MKGKILLIVIGILLLGAIGALIFDVFVLPYLLTNSYFERFQFVKDFKSGKIIINPKEQVYIQENTALENAVERVKKSVVAVQGTKASGTAYFGSGLIATSDGLIVTLAELTPTGAKFNILINGEKKDFKVQKVDYKKNLALIKVETNSLPTIGFADLNKIKLGQRVFLVSSTSTVGWSANEGIVRNISETTIGTNIYEKYVVSGSPLLNISGELLGLNYINAEGNVSAMSIDQIKAFLGL